MMKKALLSLVIVNLLAACSSTKEPVKVEQKTAEPVSQTSTNTGADTSGTQQNMGGDANRLDPLKDPNNQLSKRNVYFDYDKYDIKSEYKSLVEAHARFLAQNPSRTVRIEGNADERGSREYNLALGQKRAEAVRKALAATGASDRQVEAVSNGEEKPRATGSDESAYTENRRADLFYNGE
ncbi:peptidoglycan-associated lipoprotein Pal [Chitinimonas lacunae]|uniref:Peptidoglycan-associated lipoprotein n=1 Tax=Chitinimonas lacunae TaxID=1963018 RepID=A0ABV8MRS4_9NEIS